MGHASLIAVIGTMAAQPCSNLQMSEVLQRDLAVCLGGALFSMNIKVEEMAILTS